MKRKIAVFANGWSDEYLLTALKGIRKCATENDIDVYFFVEYASANTRDENVQGEINLLNLPNLDDFDGALLTSNSTLVDFMFKNPWSFLMCISN